MSRKRPAHLKAVEGNQGHATAGELETLAIDTSPPAEPTWSAVFPSPRGDRIGVARARRLRGWASDEWCRIAPALANVGLTASVDLQVLERHTTTYAMIRECLRDLALRGLIVVTERGAVRNPSAIVLKQLQETIRTTETKLGLTPLDRDALGSPMASGPAEGADEGNPFAMGSR